MTDPNWNLPPEKHQLEAYKKHRDTMNWSHFWDQGTGKTAETLAQAAHLYRTGKITGLLVLAPAGVEANWHHDEIPLWWPKDLPMECFWWTSSKSKTKKFAAAYDEFTEADGMKILCMAYNGMMTDRGAKTARKFLDTHDVMYVLDESTAIKTPDAKTTKRISRSACTTSRTRCVSPAACGQPRPGHGRH